MDMDMGNTLATATSTAMSMATNTATATSSTQTAMAMSMGGSTGCKLSMLLNWNTIDACFLFPSFHIRSPFTFFLACLGSFLLVISLEFLRRFQREFDRYLRTRKTSRPTNKEYILPEEMEEKLLDKDPGRDVEKGGGVVKEKLGTVVVVEQFLRGMLHMVQFSVILLGRLSLGLWLVLLCLRGILYIQLLMISMIGKRHAVNHTLHQKPGMEFSAKVLNELWDKFLEEIYLNITFSLSTTTTSLYDPPSLSTHSPPSSQFLSLSPSSFSFSFSLQTNLPSPSPSSSLLISTSSTTSSTISSTIYPKIIKHSKHIHTLKFPTFFTTPILHLITPTINHISTLLMLSCY